MSAPSYVYEIVLRDDRGRERKVLADHVHWLPGRLACRMHTLIAVDEVFPAREVAKVIRLEVADGAYRPADEEPEA